MVARRIKLPICFSQNCPSPHHNRLLMHSSSFRIVHGRRDSLKKDWIFAHGTSMTINLSASSHAFCVFYHICPPAPLFIVRSVCFILTLVGNDRHKLISHTMKMSDVENLSSNLGKYEFVLIFITESTPESDNILTTCLQQ